MRYYSVFSGVEAATLAWEPLGWEPLLFCEIDEFPSAVLKHRWPNVPNLGDIKAVNWKSAIKTFGRPDLIVGGSPCQSFSVAGTRTGLDGESGLMWEYVRALRDVRPDWILWENVPGALSSSHGEDFRCLLESLDALGYGLAWRVLDAQFFGVPQRRERLFLVGNLGRGGSPGLARYFLSPKACLGILRRAETRGKSLPEILESALKRQVSNGTKVPEPEAWDTSRSSHRPSPPTTTIQPSCACPAGSPTP